MLIKSAVFVLLYLVAYFCHAQSSASALFNELKTQVYQIRVIDKASDNKSSIGSGFQLTADGYLATNYHVISETIHKPEKYKLEFIHDNGSTGDIELIGIDVIHDLAILKIDPPTDNFFDLNLSSLSKGDRIYSMGNPHDLGTTIIEGNYNGLIEASRYHKILFSGSLNPGMSGGPAFDHEGNVIGVNVSKGPEQLSFLVPAENLDKLFKHSINNGRPEKFETEIENLILSDQNQFYDDLIKKQWDTSALGKLQLPNNISQSLKCWGHTEDEDDVLYKAVHQHCQSQDELYIHSEHYTGSFSYDYEWVTTEQLNQIQFYHYLESRYRHKEFNNAYSDDDVTNYECNTDFVEIAQRSWRASSCIRAYKKYTKLYDAILILALIDKPDQSAILKIGATGINKTNIQRLFKKFMESIKWIP